ncbi:hypothetical protein AOPFMNJM_0196 [Methylobacterium jeotgali]|uniref:Uncharacterized protein n=1 Tax=Methylobacterium jeotgali TaxID=381630 RepID=A0ABQ4SNW3_9HYPH|nr:hypothetical protein AOPFMNJM_0196 [Methylobacterium jeotgali]
MAEDDTIETMPPMASSNRSASSFIIRLRWTSAASRERAASADRASFSISPWRNTSTAAAISPISLRSPAFGMRAEVSPFAIRFMTCAIFRTGVEMVSTHMQAMPRVSATEATTTIRM